MKYLTLMLLLLSGGVFAQGTPITSPQPRKAVLEQFTGIHCSSCPNGHRIADSLKAVKPAGSVFLVNIHTGGPAAPNAGEPDFRTADGAIIAGTPGMNAFYPSAPINRQRFGTNVNLSVSPSQWSNYIDSVQSETASHNIETYATLDVVTRVLKVNVNIYAILPSVNSNTRHFTVMLLEDSVWGPQLGATNYTAQINPVNGSYKHNNVLRKVITPAYFPTTANTYGGTFIGGAFYYTLPLQFANTPLNMGNLKILAFLHYNDSVIANAATGPITLTGFTNAKDAELASDIQIEKEVCEATLKPLVRIYNNGSAPITSATLQSSLNGGPFLPAGAFSGSIAPATSALVAVPQISFAPNATNNLKFKIVNVNGSPDSNPANDTLTVGNILRTTRLAQGRYVSMRFTQDRFGAESTWQITEEATGTVKLAGGPYPNLSNNGTALHTDSFYADPERCYEVVVKDKSANGINSGSGAGGYQIVSNSQVIYASNGQFGSRDRAVFKTAESLMEPSGVNNVFSFDGGVSLLPNPVVGGETNLEFRLERGGRLRVEVVDMTGRVVARVAEQSLSAGLHRMPIVTSNLAGGVYSVRLATAQGVVTQKLVVVK